MSKSNEREGSNFRRLEAVVVEKSEADCFGTARYEWDVVDRYDAVASDGAPARCACGHEPIRECFILRNRINGNVIDPVGNVCVNHFGVSEMTDASRRLSEVARVSVASAALPRGTQLPLRKDESPDKKTAFSRSTIDALLDCGALDPREGDGLAGYSAERGRDVVLSAFNKRSPSGRLLNFAHAFIERRVRPFLAEAEGLALR